MPLQDVHPCEHMVLRVPHCRHERQGQEFAQPATLVTWDLRVLRDFPVGRAGEGLAYPGLTGRPSKRSTVANSATERRESRRGKGASGHPTAKWAAMR